MLTFDQAAKIVSASITKTTGHTVGGASMTLFNAGIISDKLTAQLIHTISRDADVGVISESHYLDLNALGHIGPGTSVGDLTDFVFKISARKLCSNGTTPHEQTYPYPLRCALCGCAVYP